MFSHGEEVPEDLLTHPIKPVCLGSTSIERIRPGLICVHSQWEKLRMKDECLSGKSASSKRLTSIILRPKITICIHFVDNVQTRSFGQLEQHQTPTQSSFMGISPAGSNFRQAYSITNKSASTLITQPANMNDLGAQQVFTRLRSLN